jgi:hypothetical protein
MPRNEDSAEAAFIRFPERASHFKSSGNELVFLLELFIKSCTAFSRDLPFMALFLRVVKMENMARSYRKSV